jgi:type I restriction enzyme M protein
MLEDLKKTLWATADKLRANMDAAEYKHLVLGLIFVKYISDTFQARRTELTARFADPADEYFLDDGAPEQLAAELEDRDYYREANVFWVPEAARWEAIRAAAKQPDIGRRIDDALTLIEVENPRLKGILDKRFARAQLPDGKLGELVDLVSTIGFGESAATAREMMGRRASALGVPVALTKRNPPPEALIFDQIAAELEQRAGLTKEREPEQGHASLLD